MIEFIKRLWRSRRRPSVFHDDEGADMAKSNFDKMISAASDWLNARPNARPDDIGVIYAMKNAAPTHTAGEQEKARNAVLTKFQRRMAIK